ncbi:MAG: hypothetical protein RIR65_1517 [Planctomycetota bacterium]|jgi:hypothetical protein
MKGTSIGMKPLLLLLAPASLGCLGLLPGPRGSDPIALLVWLALVAPACGAWARRLGLPLFPHALGIVGCFGFALAAAGAVGVRMLPSPMGGLLVVAGLLAVGWGLACGLERTRLHGGGVLVVGAMSSLLGLLPGAGLLLGRPLEPAWAEWTLQASPVVATLAAAGVDVLRHPLVYDSATTSLSGPWSSWAEGLLAPSLAFVGTWTSAWWLERRARVAQAPDAGGSAA